MFNSVLTRLPVVAQLVEQEVLNFHDAGSNPADGSEGWHHKMLAFFVYNVYLKEECYVE